MSESKDNFEYVIIGGGNAAGYACKEFVDLGITKSSTVCMISSGDVLPYERPALSKGFLLKKNLKLPTFNTCAFMKQKNEMKYYEENNINVKLSTTVTNIDYESKIITTNDNNSIKYNKLLLATGCSAVKFSDFLTEDKSKFNNIYYLRDIKDAQNIKQTIFNIDEFKNTECVIIGGGYIGMEVTSAIISNGSFKKVTMVFPEEHMMKSRNLFTKTIAEKYHALYSQKGVEFICNSDDILVDSFEGDKDGNVTFVKLKNGTKISAKVVIVGIGARANIELFKDKLDVDTNTKGLNVNKYLQSVSNKDVYGCGDIISFNCLFLTKKIRLEHVRHARASGMFAVRSMTDKLNENEKQNGYDFLPVFYSRVFGQSWVFYGDNPIVDKDKDYCKYEVKVYCKDIKGDNDRQFKLCAIWMSKGKGDIIGILVDTCDENEKKMVEDAVRNKKNFKDMNEFINGFKDESEMNKNSKVDIGEKRALEDENEEEEPPKKKQRTK